jgi:hypothetical protein
MTTKEIYMTPEDLEIIQKVIAENSIKSAFKLIYDNGSGIGSTLDLEFDADVHGREATIRIPISGVENW